MLVASSASLDLSLVYLVSYILRGNHRSMDAALPQNVTQLEMGTSCLSVLYHTLNYEACDAVLSNYYRS